MHPQPPLVLDFRRPVSKVKWYYHKVRKGDTLYSISRKYYRSDSHWKLIYDCNRKVLRNPGDLTVGKKLLIPAARTR